MCVWLLPLVAMHTVVFVLRSPFTLTLALALLATSWLLVIGTISLRMMLKNFEGDRNYSDYWLPVLHYLQLPSLLLVMATIAVTFTDVAACYPMLSASQYAALLFTVLATLEYINYYHRQLQHFDHQEDFKRLLAGKGLRKSHLARALATWRKSRRRSPSFPSDNSTNDAC